VAFGEEAFTRYSELKSRKEHGNVLLFAEFKMQLRPGATRFGRGDPTSFTVGASDRREKFRLLLPVVATLRHVKHCVLQQLSKMLGQEVLEEEVS